MRCFAALKIMANVLLRTVIVFAAVLIMTRLMGKRQIGELQPYEFAITLIAADLATTPMSNLNAPLLWGIAPIYVLCVLGLTISLLSLKSIRARRLFCGQPCVLINKGVIVEDTLKKLRYTLNDLLEQLRSKDIFDIGDVYYAILETNGEISVIKKAEKAVPCAQDLQVTAQQEEPSIALVLDGKIQDKNLEYSGMEKTEFEKILKKNGFSVENLLLATVSGNELFLHKKGASPQIKSVRFKK